MEKWTVEKDSSGYLLKGKLAEKWPCMKLSVFGSTSVFVLLFLPVIQNMDVYIYKLILLNYDHKWNFE